MKIKLIMKPSFSYRNVNHLQYAVKFVNESFYHLRDFSYFKNLNILQNNSFTICRHTIIGLKELVQKIDSNSMTKTDIIQSKRLILRSIEKLKSN